MKKLLSLLLASMLAFGTAAVTASADSVILRDSVDANIIFPQAQKSSTNKSDDYGTVTNTYADDGKKKVTGRTITVNDQGDNTSFSTVSFGDRLSYNAYYYSSSSNSYITGTSVVNFKGNFVWEFDFKLDTLPEKDKQFIFEIGTYGDTNSWKNAIKFQRTNNGEYYYLVWGAVGSNDSVYISNPNGADATYYLSTGQTYHLKIEADLEKTGKMYVTFTNPNIDADGAALTDNAAPYTRTTVAPLALPVTTDVSTFATSAWNDTKRPTVKVYSKGPIKLELSNESFKIDRFRTGVPTIEIPESANTQIKATAQFANITGTDLWCYAPSFICAAYDKDGVIVRMGIVNLLNDAAQNNKMVKSTLNTYSTKLYDMDKLGNGTYTVKTFIWSALSGTNSLKYYENAYTERQVTVQNGVVTIVDDTVSSGTEEAAE